MSSMPTAKLLIVDDDAAQMKALCRTLESEGFTIKGFTSAVSALSTLRDEVFDVLLSDLMMPGMDGIGLMRSALAIDPHLVGIVMTGHATVDTAVQAMKEGALDYILKPFRLSSVLPVLARALAVRRLRLENIQLHQALGIYELSMGTALAEDFGTVLRKVADAAFRQPGANHVSVFLPCRDAQELQVALAQGESGAVVQGARIPFGDELSRWLEQSRGLLARPDELTDARATFTSPLPGVPSGISLPMLAGGKLIGILNIGSPDARLLFAPGQLKTLSILANTAASALEGASLLQELRHAEQRYRRLAENAPDIVSRYETHPQRCFSYVSPVVTAISGYTPEEHYHDPDLGLKIVHPEDRPILEAVWRGERPSGSSVTMRWVHKKGTIIWVEQKNVLVRDEAGTLVAIEGITRDITERRRLEEEVEQAQRLESVGRLAAGVAHDFNNLLTVINGYTQMTMDELPEESPLRANLEEVRNSGDSAAALTQQLLAFSRKQLVKASVLNLNTSIRDILKALRRLIGEDISIRTALDVRLGNVFADPGKVQQIIMNLVVNARDAMRDGGVIVLETSNVVIDTAAQTNHPEAHPGRHILLSVSDTGTGMTPEVQARLFEPFFTTKPQGVGTGLGLATVHGMVKQAGGWIEVSSELGRGSTFRVFLPRIDMPVTEESVVVKLDIRGNENILVVEDQTDVRNLTVQMLTKLGYSVYSACSSEEALELTESIADPIHLLVTDVIMPGMNGRQLADRMRALRPQLRILYTSGYTDDIIGHHGVLDPGVAYLEKPFTIDTLGEKVRDALGVGAT